MADYNIKAEITADTSGFESGVKKAQKASKSLSSSISNVVKGFGKSGLSGAISSAGLALGGIGLAIGVATKAVKAMSKTIGECTEAYKKQLNAERALDTAIENSPLLGGSASKNLKDFASQIQRTSNMGDEELLPMMSQLVATGRNEAEVMKIIQTATDMAATGTISFDTAVTQLNATLNGNVGRLGQQNAELKGLTEEELKNGKAVDILAEKYKGMAENTIDTSKQLKNAIGDLKEAYGNTFENALAPVRKYFTTIIQGWADAKKAREEYEGAKTAFEKGTATGSQLVLYYEQQLKYIADDKLMYEGMYGADLQYAQEKLKTLELEENKYKSLIATEKYKQKQEEKARATAVEQQNVLDEEAAKEEEIAKLKEKYLLKIAEQEAKWENIKTVTGEVTSNEEKLKFYQDELVAIMTEAGGQITKNNEYYKEQAAIIDRLAKGIQATTGDSGYGKKLIEQEIETLEEKRDAELGIENLTANEKLRIQNDYNSKLRALKESLINDEMEAALKSVENYANAEEEKQKIAEYYQIQKQKMFEKYAVSDAVIGEAVKSYWEEIWDSISLEGIAAFKETFKKIAEMSKKVGSQIVQIVNKIASLIKSSFKGITGGLKKLFEFDPSKALDDLLAFEDSVLTFFVETLPNLPQFFESALQSVLVLLTNISQYINSDQIKGVISGIIDAFVKYLPDIMDMGMVILETLFDGFMAALDENKDKIIALGNKIIETITKGFNDFVLPMVEKLGEFLDAIIDAWFPIAVESFIKSLPKFLTAIITGVVKSLKTIINVVVDLLPDLIEAILDVLEYLITDVIPDLLPYLIETISKIITMLTAALPRIIKDLIVLVSAIVESIPPILTDLLPAIISSILKLLPDIIFAVIDGVITLIKNLTTQDLLALIAALGSMIINIAFALLEFIPYTVSVLFDGLTKGIENTSWQGIKDAFASGFGKVAEDFKLNWQKAIWSIQETFENMIDSMFGWLKAIAEFIDNLLDKASGLGDKIKAAVGDSKIVQGVKKAGEAVGDAAKTAGGWVADKATSAWNGITSLFKHADGTNATHRGLALVGEAGPELVRFSGGEQVLNNRNTQKVLANMGKGSSIFNVTFNNTQDTTAFAMMSQLKQYQRNLSFNGVL